MKTLKLSLFAFLFAVLCLSSAGAQTVSPDLFGALKWRLIGPFRGGRAVAVAGIPGNGTTFYFGAVDGGIWQTTDAGVVWKPIFDSQHVASIGALAVAPSDPQVIYAGTGESDIRSDLSSGDGVYRSTDDGQTWSNVGLRDTKQISQIVIDPRDASVVYVAALGHTYTPNAERGVFKSTDGGANWSKILDLGPDIGASDLAIASANPDILFATVWRAHRPPWSTYAPIAGPGSGLYRSRDGGATWMRLTSSGLPEGDWGRTAVAVSTDGKRVYALVDAKKGGGLYRSDDGGDTWTLANSDRRITSRAWYFGNITVDPENPDVIYMPNVALYRSEDGGKTISVLRGA
ncbi:MAG: sialidase family protein, partial [Terriglobales bacterium]